MTNESPESCMETAIEALGGFKAVGHMLRPEMSPPDAGKWLSRCINDDHAQRVNYSQETLLWRTACQKGQHDGFAAYAASIGYRIEPIDRSAEIVALSTRAEEHANRAGELA